MLNLTQIFLVCGRYRNIYTDVISRFLDFSLSDFVFANVKLD